MYKLKRHIIFFVSAILIGSFISSLNSCKKEAPLNPFDRDVILDTLNNDTLYTKSIEGLYQNIFKPNCSTSGCHDGTFEPDFRSLESSFNTLVWSDIISNDASNPLSYRVEPNNASNSMIIKRLTSFVPNTSGIMPLEVSPDSDWTEKKDDYIQDVRDWINDGAKDIFGNETNTINLKPQLTGFYITASGSNTPLSRNVNGVTLIPSSTNNIDLYIGISDNETASDLLTENKLEISLNQTDFSLATEYSMGLITPVTNPGYLGSTQYFHKVSISNIDALWDIDQYVFFKAIVNDGTNPDSDLPGANTLDHIKSYYSFKRVL